MGVQLTDLLAPETIGFEALSGKKIAIDALNTLYQFLSSIRQPDGTPLMDSTGRVTSHLTGLFYRNANLLEYGILPIYVFDGKPPKLKGRVVEARKRAREEARSKWEEARAAGRLEEARTYAQQSSRLTDEMLNESKQLLDALGIPHVQAPSEGEAQAAYMVSKGDAWGVGSQDYDALLFGSPKLVRNLTLSGKRKVPRKKEYVTINPELIYLTDVLSGLGITRDQLIDIAILIGTDFNPKGVGGIGPKKALALVKEYGSAESGLAKKGIEFDFDVDEIKEIFLGSYHTDDYELVWQSADEASILDFL
ncbi:MAG: flap endonuclease-1, partial [Candidatus Hydrothermarchaeales archaeon]